jgi:predicted cation transporter
LRGGDTITVRTKILKAAYIRDLEFVSFLQMLGEGFDELLSWYVFHTHCVA